MRKFTYTPVAVLTAPGSVEQKTTVKLDGSRSSDPDGDVLTWFWTQTAGPGVVLVGATTATPTFTAPDVKSDTTLTFTLRVSDGTLVSSAQTASIVVYKKPPKPARPGSDLTVQSGEAVNLDGTLTSDPTGTALLYAWTQFAGPAVPLGGMSAATASFVAPDVKATTRLGFRLQVSDGRGGISTTQLFVTVDSALSGGCSSAGGGSVAPLLGLFGLLLMRRRRAAK